MTELGNTESTVLTVCGSARIALDTQYGGLDERPAGQRPLAIGCAVAEALGTERAGQDRQTVGSCLHKEARMGVDAMRRTIQGVQGVPEQDYQLGVQKGTASVDQHPPKQNHKNAAGLRIRTTMTDGSAKTMCLRIVSKRRKYANYKIGCLTKHYVWHFVNKYGRVLVHAHATAIARRVIRRATKLGIVMSDREALIWVLKYAGEHGISTVRP